jgi:GT2 family glycosyltransferase
LPKGFSLDVFLVDDGSSDGTDLAVNKEFPDVVIIKGTGDLYWNRGMYLAWETAVETKESFDYYLWLNDDVKLFLNSIEIILKDSLEDPLGNTLLCGVMSSEYRQKITYGGNDKNGNLLTPNGVESQDCIEINGNFVLITKQIFEKVGMLDPIFPHAIGDYDYGFRCITNQITCKITSQVVGYCEENPRLPVWCRPEVKFLNRMKSLYSPLGNSHPYYYTIYINRHFGLLRAIKNLISIHIRVIFPSLWKK